MRRLRGLIVLSALLIIVIVPAFNVLAQGQQKHTVQTGETLFRIALRYGVTVEAIVAANNLPNASRIVTGQVLIIPAAGDQFSPNPAADMPEAVLASSDPLIHTVARGETLNEIAKQYGVAASAIVTANNLINADLLEVGQRLIIPGKTAAPGVAVTVTSVPAEPTSAPLPPGMPVVPSATPQPQIATEFKLHTVSPGENLAAIARKYNVSWQTLASLNKIPDPNTLYSGTQLKIPPTNGLTTTISTAPGPIGSSVPDPAPGDPNPYTVGKRIKVVLSEQKMYALEDGIPVRETLVSTGLPATPTVVGDFKVYLKYKSQLMYGPGYYLPGVPWVMYFYRDYGLHGAYWHSNWGRPMSHGCVNIPIDEAKWFYQWSPLGTPVTVVW
jgi:LysM repeat protein